MYVAREKVRAGAWGFVFSGGLAVLILAGSRNLDHFDAALVGYTFATLFATFAITYRYAMWLQRPPTRMYWRRGWQVFFTGRFFGRNLLEFVRRFVLLFAANQFVFRRGGLRGLAHWLIILHAAAVIFTLLYLPFGKLFHVSTGCSVVPASWSSSKARYSARPMPQERSPARARSSRERTSHRS